MGQRFASISRKPTILYSTFPMNNLFSCSRPKRLLVITSFIWDAPLNADVHITHVDRSGRRSEQQFDCRYLLPTDPLTDSDVVSFSQFEDWRLEREGSDAEKRRYFRDKVIVDHGQEHKGGRNIRYWTCYVSERAVWRTLSQKVSLPPPPE